MQTIIFIKSLIIIQIRLISRFHYTGYQVEALVTGIIFQVSDEPLVTGRTEQRFSKKSFSGNPIFFNFTRCSTFTASLCVLENH